MQGSVWPFDEFDDPFSRRVVYQRPGRSGGAPGTGNAVLSRGPQAVVIGELDPFLMFSGMGPTLHALLSALMGGGLLGPGISLDDIVTQQLLNGEPQFTPATRQDIDNLPTIVITAADLAGTQEDRKKCTICQEDFTAGAKATKLPCDHIFCPPCLRKWLETNRTCPLCREEIVNILPNGEKARSSQDRRQNGARHTSRPAPSGAEQQPQPRNAAVRAHESFSAPVNPAVPVERYVYRPVAEQRGYTGAARPEPVRAYERTYAYPSVSPGPYSGGFAPVNQPEPISAPRYRSYEPEAPRPRFYDRPYGTPVQRGPSYYNAEPAPPRSPYAVHPNPVPPPAAPRAGYAYSSSAYEPVMARQPFVYDAPRRTPNPRGPAPGYYRPQTPVRYR